METINLLTMLIYEHWRSKLWPVRLNSWWLERRLCTPCWSTPSSTTSRSQPSPIIQVNRTIRPSKKPIVSSPLTQRQSRVPTMRSRTTKSISSWRRWNTRSSAKSPLSSRPTPVEFPPLRHVHAPSMKRSSSKSKWKISNNTMSVVTSTLPSATNLYQPSRILASPYLRTKLRDTPAPHCSSYSAISMDTMPGYWPQTLRQMTRIWGRPSTLTSLWISYIQGSTSA